MAESGSFRDRHWGHRFEAMGDQAEAVFEKVWPTGWVRYGLNRPPIRVQDLPPTLRYTPDYLTGKCFVEVQGFGGDGTLKLKLEKAEALWDWENVHPVTFFIYDSKNAMWTTCSLETLCALCREYSVVQQFPEGKDYWALNRRHLPKPWTPVG